MGNKEMVRQQRLDTAMSVFAARQIEQVQTRAFNVKYPDFEGRNFVPVNNEGSPGVKFLTYRQYTYAGLARLLASYGDDVPRADVLVNEYSAKVHTVATSFGFSIDEIEAAKFAGVPLDQQKANAARQAYETQVDRIFTTGDSGTGMYGIANQPNAQTMTIPNGATLSPLWANKTGREIAKDIFDAQNTMVTTTLGIERPTTILLSLERLQYIATQPYDEDNPSGPTILEFVTKVGLYVKEFLAFRALSTASLTGAQRMIVYRKDPNVLEGREPLPFQMLPVQEEGFEFITFCRGKIGGVVAYYPMAILYADDF